MSHEEVNPVAIDVDDSAVATLPVQLVFTAGEIVMPLQKLYAMNTGEVIHLQRVATSEVDISANGLCIGKGELVDIDGSLAVEVKSLKGRP